MEQRSNDWYFSASKHFGTEPIVLPADCMPWSLIWKAKLPRRSPTRLRFTVLKSRYGCETGRKKDWMEFWKDTGLDVLPTFPSANGRNWPTSLIVDPWRMGSVPAFGHVRWLAALLKMNSLSPIIPHTFPKFSTNSNFRFTVPEKYWQKLIKTSNPVGFADDSPMLKKSQKREGSAPLRRRSLLPSRPYPLPNMGQGRSSAGNSHHRPAQHSENIRNYRAIFRQIPLPVPRCFQCPNLHQVPGKSSASLFSPQNTSHPGQCFLPQRRRCLVMVLGTPQTHRGTQFTALFSRTQCVGKNLAPYTGSWNTQSLFSVPRRIARYTNHNVSQYSAQSISSSGIFASISIMSPFLCKAI